jgi:hypothetical protein
VSDLINQSYFGADFSTNARTITTSESTSPLATMTSEGRSSLEHLTTELVLSVTENLRSRDLKCLALVLSTVKALAESTLHRKVIVRVSGSDPELWSDEELGTFYLADFFFIMLQRPDLRSKVQYLALEISCIRMPIQLTQLFGQDIPASTLAPSLNIEIPESQLAGQLLAILPGVQMASLDTCTSSNHRLNDPMFDLFRDSTSEALASPTLVSAFATSWF